MPRDVSSSSEGESANPTTGSPPKQLGTSTQIDYSDSGHNEVVVDVSIGLICV